MMCRCSKPTVRVFVEDKLNAIGKIAIAICILDYNCKSFNSRNPSRPISLFLDSAPDFRAAFFEDMS